MPALGHAPALTLRTPFFSLVIVSGLKFQMAVNNLASGALAWYNHSEHGLDSQEAAIRVGVALALGGLAAAQAIKEHGDLAGAPGGRPGGRAGGRAGAAAGDARVAAAALVRARAPPVPPSRERPLFPPPHHHHTHNPSSAAQSRRRVLPPTKGVMVWTEMGANGEEPCTNERSRATDARGVVCDAACERRACVCVCVCHVTLRK